MSRTTIGAGRVVASQTDVFAAPLVAYTQPGSVPGVIYCHELGGSAVSLTNPQADFGDYGLYDALRQKYCVGLGDFGGDSWGNDAAISDLSAMQTWMQTTMGAKSGKVALVGNSMGATVALNYALANPTKVACVACVIPFLNLASGVLTSSINTAYGGTYNDTTMGPTHNPVDYAATFPNIPVHFWYSTADTTALPASVTTFVSNCTSAQATVISTTLNHGQAAIAAAPIGDVLSFIASGNW